MKAKVLSLILAVAIASTGFGKVVDGIKLTDSLPKDCLVEALEYQCALIATRDLRHVTWARLFYVTRTHRGKIEGHALCVYALRNGELRSYDTMNGSLRLDTRDQDEKSILRSLTHIDSNIRSGKFID